MAGLSWISIAAMAMMVLLMEVRVAPAHLPTGVRNCRDVQREGFTKSDVYDIYPYDCCPQRRVKVYCDMETDGGGWTVIQRRTDLLPREDFFRTWIEFALGFGNLTGEFWLSLDHIHTLTDQAHNQVRFDLADFDGNTRWAKYKFFYVHDRSLSYKMEVNGYTGDAGNSLASHNGFAFSAKDKDLDLNDSDNRYKGAWWYSVCHESNLNGLYLNGQHESFANGINWKAWRGYNYSLKKTEIKIRPSY